MRSSQTDLPPIGTVLTSSFDPAIVATAFFASLVGCLLTVEILQRRGTALGNWRSWCVFDVCLFSCQQSLTLSSRLETFACAVSMGLVGIWCMHFIGNRAIIIGNGDASIQLAYNPGWTVLSVFLPILGLSVAFASAEMHFSSSTFHRSAVGFTGVLAGGSVVGMHYVGNLGISNYALGYKPRFVIASVIIAVGDCLAVLMLFYRWRERWISFWWQRLICAILLASGVSAMHFTASTMCTYLLKQYVHGPERTSRNVQVAIAGVLCGATAVVVLGFLFFYRYRRRLLHSQSKKFMLACAIFDPDGRLLVTNEGTFPHKEITDQYNHRTFSEEFDTAHPVFRWIFRVTHHWQSVVDLMPSMKCHLGGCDARPSEDIEAASSAPDINSDPDAPADYSVIFREQFCSAAMSLATDLQISVGKLGVLYDQVISIGTCESESRFPTADEILPARAELGHGIPVVGEGQLLFVTRQVTREEALRLLNTGQGFRFAEFSQVRRLLASFLRITVHMLDGHLDRLARYNAQLSKSSSAGTWLSLFALIPTPGRDTFDVAVKKSNAQRLPDVLLLPDKPTSGQRDSLRNFHDLTLDMCLQNLALELMDSGVSLTPDQEFASTLQRAIYKLMAAFPGAWLRHARFLAKPLVAHYHSTGPPDETSTTLYSFYVIIDMHSWNSSVNLERVPLTFFDIRQRCYPGSPDHAVLTRDIHQEFGPLLARGPSETAHQCYHRRSRLTLNSRSSVWSVGRRSDVQGQEFAEHAQSLEMPNLPHSTHRAPLHRRETAWGGILVHNETVIKSHATSEVSAVQAEVVESMGVNVAVSTLKPEWTFVDELVTITKARFVRTSI